MSAIPSNDFTAAYGSATEAFLAISTIHLGSIERLSALNLNVMLQSVEDLAATAKLLPEFKSVFEARNLRSVLGQPLLETPLAYSRSTCEIVTGTQREISEMMLKGFSQPNMVSVVQESWSAALDLLTRGFRQITAADRESLAAGTNGNSRAVATTTTSAKEVG